MAEETEEKKEVEEKEASKPEKKKGGMGKKIILGIVGIIVLFAIIGAIGGGGKKETQEAQPTQPAEVKEEVQKPEKEQAQEALEVSTSEFISEFDENQLAAEEKYKDKLIEFTAVIDNISEDILGTPFLSLKPTAEEFYLGTSIKCSFKEKSELTAVKNGQTVTLQGTVDTQSLGIISIKNCKIVGP